MEKEGGGREKEMKGGERNGVEGKMNIPRSCACAAAGKRCGQRLRT
jgi:hypothetical protein